MNQIFRLFEKAKVSSENPYIHSDSRHKILYVLVAKELVTLSL